MTAIKSEKYKKIGLKSTYLSAILWVSFILRHPVQSYHRKGIQQLSWTSREFLEAGLFEYQAYLELYLSRNQDLLLGVTVIFILLA